MGRDRAPPQRASTVRCAVYTRKSTEEGLDQSFNSLDAQREACEAYISSQRHEGWSLVRGSYDDGGYSGGNMDRPGLKRLLADVAAGRVDVIVVYKVDRLTRSLADFAKIVEILDGRSACFVSVTQSFNTTTSMGRLTLNVLLSFAQFEREVTGERIRDKIAASKAKGMWMGGTPPLGYDVVDRKLVVNEAEAEQVRHIFQRYIDLGSGQALLEELRATGYRTKRYTKRGGIPFTRGPLFHVLKNRIYLGLTVHRDISYPGDHQAIVDQPLWDAVQATMAAQRVKRKSARNIKSPSLLAGRLRDGEGRRMSPSHAVKSGRRYHYYVTPTAELETNGTPAWSVSARDLELAVIHQLQNLVRDRPALIALAPQSLSAERIRQLILAGNEIAARLDISTVRKAVVEKLVQQVQLTEGSIVISIAIAGLAELLGLDAVEDLFDHIIKVPAVRVRRGKDVKLVVADNHGRAEATRDEVLVDLLVEARKAYRIVIDQPDKTIRDIAKDVGKCRTRFARLLRVAMLAPDIIEATAKGAHPAGLTAKKLLEVELPIAWPEQRRVLGFT